MRSFISGKADPQAALTNNRSTAPKRGRGADTAAISAGFHYAQLPWEHEAREEWPGYHAE
ncbi:hypothetical protein GCM10017600_84870 [Streptosporangium carneum]|uniref:Uncharacterized protein n=1 Tax=Streptosporangium carneum TaxID=47481 RepID=A0A9W6ICA8_9ACTN|nr:hypothetical protein GCM10017600_84870 [Streptosporangium carneum]